MMPPFVIYGLPRSRTFWLSKFLTRAGWVCGHDEIRFVRSLEDVRAYFRQPCVGTVETAAAPWWRLISEMLPEARVVVVRRPVEEVIDSMVRTGLFDRDRVAIGMRRLDAKLDQIERRVPGVMSVSFAGLATEETCRQISMHCIGSHDPAWFAMLSGINLQCDLPAMLRYYAAYQPQLAKVAAVARHHIIAGLCPAPAPLDGVTIQQEPFEMFLRDGHALFDRHLVQVGEQPGNWANKNLPLMAALDQFGALQVTTARSNGRMFGYLMAVISPSLEHQGLMAVHTTFYAAEEFRGLGLRLQKASVSALKARGVREIVFHAGTRGDGPRMPALFRRLGAREHGQLFMLDLKEAA